MWGHVGEEELSRSKCLLVALVSGKRRFCPQKEPRKSSKSSAHTMAPASCLLFRYCTWWRRSRAGRVGSLGEVWGNWALWPFPKGPVHTQVQP